MASAVPDRWYAGSRRSSRATSVQARRNASGKLALALAITAAITPARVQAYPDLLLSAWPDGFYCQLDANNFFPTIYVIFSNWSGEATRVAFGAALSPNSGYAVYYTESAFNVTGDMNSGFIVDLGSCFQGSATVMQFYLVPTGEFGECPSFQVTPHPSYGGIRYFDCSDAPHRAERSTGMRLNPPGTCEVASAPYDPYPADGATNVPVSISLEWSFDEPQCGVTSGREDNIYFGTVPNPPFLDIWGDEPYPLQPLQPSTTYYWKVRTRAYGLIGTSPVWSFTTASPVATKRTTWGTIRALYR